MNDEYLKQAELVIHCIPAIASETCFAIKGGTALNLFELNLPRLSVDIDITYTVISDRNSAICEINRALERTIMRLEHLGINARLSGTAASRKIYCMRNNILIKIEPNFIIRGVSLPTRKLKTCPAINAITEAEAYMQVLSLPELYGGKFCAALDRQHPRDLFDVAQFYKTHKINEEFKRGFLTFALGHNRPLHEILNPTLQDHREIFAQQFAGMSDLPFTYEDHETTFTRLRADLIAALTPEDKQNLLDFVSLNNIPESFDIPNLSRLPAIIWKQKNLDTLRKTNPKKFAEQGKLLEKVLFT